MEETNAVMENSAVQKARSLQDSLKQKAAEKVASGAHVPDSLVDDQTRVNIRR